MNADAWSLRLKTMVFLPSPASWRVNFCTRGGCCCSRWSARQKKSWVQVSFIRNGRAKLPPFLRFLGGAERALACPSEEEGKPDQLPLYLANNVRKFARERSLVFVLVLPFTFILELSPLVFAWGPFWRWLAGDGEGSWPERSDSACRRRETTVVKALPSPLVEESFSAIFNRVKQRWNTLFSARNILF